MIDGKPAEYNSEGYLINPYDSLDVAGWRTSNSTVNRFVFGSRKQSYSAKTGQGTSNVGVIGVAFFPEIPQYPRYVTPLPQLGVDYFYKSYEPVWTSSSYNVGSSALRGMSLNNVSSLAGTMTASASLSSVGSQQNLGTGYGEELRSDVYNVSFNSNPSPQTVITIYYDDRRGLEAQGIIVDRRKQRPDPFPRSNTGYCQRV